MARSALAAGQGQATTQINEECLWEGFATLLKVHCILRPVDFVEAQKGKNHMV